MNEKYFNIVIVSMFVGFGILITIYINLKIKTMMKQLKSFFEALTSPTRTFNEQSHEAHVSILESKETIYEKILEAYRRCPYGLTSEECSVEAKISYESSHKRIPELISQHKLYNSGITRKNKSGRKSMVRKIVS